MLPRTHRARASLALALLLAASCGGSTDDAAGQAPAPGADPACGDGVVQPARGEECDLGTENGDQGYCSIHCLQTSCGDGLVQTGRGESCDEGADNSDLFASCTAICQEARCGDGVVDAGEWCDEGTGNHDTGGSCTSICQAPTCGDGIQQEGESCDGEANCGPDCRWGDRSCAIHAVSDARYTVLVLREDGVLLGAGLNGQKRLLGLDSAIETQPTLTPILPGVTVSKVRALDDGGVALTPEGQVVTFGNDWLGNRGDGPGEPTEPWSLLPTPTLVSLEARRSTVLGLDADGRLWGFGEDGGGVLHVLGPVVSCGNAPCVQAPRELFPGDPTWRFLAVSLGFEHVVALRADGTLWGWGRNDECQLGCTAAEVASRPAFSDADFPQPPLFRELEPRRLFADVEGTVLFVASTTATHAVNRRGDIFALGVNYLASVGSMHDDRSYNAVPLLVLFNDAVTGIEVKPRQFSYGSDTHLLLRDEQGKVIGWGLNDHNQATTTFDFNHVVAQPVDLPDGQRAAHVSAGTGFNHVITTDGKLLAIGFNGGGQLGLGTLSDAREWSLVATCP